MPSHDATSRRGLPGRAALLALGAAALAAPVAGCKDSKDTTEPPPPAEFSGTFELRSIDGQLPLVVSSDLGGGQRRIVSGEIRVLSRGRLLEVVNYQYVPRTGSPHPVEPDSGTYGFTQSGDRILVSRPMPYPPDSYVDTATFTGGRTVRMSARIVRVDTFRPTTRYDVIYEKP